LEKLQEFLKIDKKQRFIYGIGLLLWTILWFDDFKFINIDTLVIYTFQLIIPSLLLFAQIILNNKFIWILLIGYISLYTLWIIWNIIEQDILMDIQRDFTPQPFWTFEKVRDWIIMLTILTLINWIIWKIKPIRKEKNVAQHRV
jgi:hypothetical protein